VLGGVAVGKTSMAAASYTTDCLSVPYFHALNCSVTATQAELPFHMLMNWIEENDHLEHLIQDITLRPFPIITFQNFSTYSFRTAGQRARFIRGSEYDRINYDEGPLDDDPETITVLRGRLRGKRPDGTQRMARLDVTGTPTDAEWLRERFDRGWQDAPVEKRQLSRYLSFRLPTYLNTHLTAEQMALMEAEYSDEQVDVEMRALFPDYGMSMYPSGHLRACTDRDLNDQGYLALHPESGSVTRGWVMEEHPRFGMLKWEMPFDPKGIYIIAGDPGTDGPPKRNAATVGILEVSKKPYTLVYFDWVNGKGSYFPFLDSFKYGIEKYRPSIRGMDATGTQKAINELAFESIGIHVDGINFQRDKEAMLNALSVSVTSHEMRWPFIKGLRNQMGAYTREKDRDKHLPQDIVMLLAQLAFLARYAPEDNDEAIRPPQPSYWNRGQRTAGWDRRRRT